MIIINYIKSDDSPFVVHVEELADELVDGVLGLQLDVHRQEEGREEEDRARQRDQLGRTLNNSDMAVNQILANPSTFSLVQSVILSHVRC